MVQNKGTISFVPKTNRRLLYSLHNANIWLQDYKTVILTYLSIFHNALHPLSIQEKLSWMYFIPFYYTLYSFGFSPPALFAPTHSLLLVSALPTSCCSNQVPQGCLRSSSLCTLTALGISSSLMTWNIIY